MELREQEYDSEALLQELLARYPSVLAGDQDESARPRKWLLISREAGLPSEPDGANRWSVDHLFLDQAAVPTIVEVKQSTDTRIRREVVGQMLDYAANAVVYWPVEALRAAYESRCREQGVDPDEKLGEFLGMDADTEQFWQKVKTNLKAGQVRLVFVADRIPDELKRIVEFLNEQMDPAEVLALEVKQYAGQGLITLVPRVIGRTSEAQQRKSTTAGERRQWDEGTFLRELEARRGPAEVAIAKRITAWAVQRMSRLGWGKGKQYGSCYLILDWNGRHHYPFVIWTNGGVEVQFQWEKEKPPFEDESKRLEWLGRLNAIPGVSIPQDGIIGRPSIPLSVLKNDSAMNQFLGVVDWVAEQIKAV